MGKNDKETKDIKTQVSGKYFFKNEQVEPATSRKIINGIYWQLSTIIWAFKQKFKLWEIHIHQLIADYQLFDEIHGDTNECEFLNIV